MKSADGQDLLREKAVLVANLRLFFADKPVKKVWLFGSFARGEFGPDSDVDILIAPDYSAPIGWEYFGWWSDLETLTGRRVDLVSEGYLSRHVRPFVEQEKELIYEKN